MQTGPTVPRLAEDPRFAYTHTSPTHGDVEVIRDLPTHLHCLHTGMPLHPYPSVPCVLGCLGG